jgi:hypothetical protein
LRQQRFLINPGGIGVETMIGDPHLALDWEMGGDAGNEVREVGGE